MHVTFNRAWAYDLDEPKGSSRRFRAGWEGDLDDKVAKMAIEAEAAAETGAPAAKNGAKTQGVDVKQPIGDKK